MFSSCKPLVLFVLVALWVPVLAEVPDVQADARQQVQKLRLVDPQQYARLRHNLAVFQQLPAARQEAIRKLDKDLQDEPAGMRGRLERTLERYADWLEHLPEAERKKITQAPDRKARLERIRELRERQWLERLPKAQAAKVQSAPPEQRAGLIAQLRREDTEQRLDWLIAQRNWDGVIRNPGNAPTRVDNLQAETREYLEKSLRPLLSQDEERQLLEAQDKWPRFPRVLVEMIDSHPLSVLGPIGPLHIRELQLPPFLEKDFKVSKRLREAEGKWPEFGVAARELANLPLGKKLVKPLESAYTPARPEDFPTMVQRFVEKKLIPALALDELQRLKKAEGQWPAYPRAVVELARAHNLQLPTGPQRFDYWDRYRWRSTETGGSGRRRDFFWP